jgi:hypothetical protein
MESSFNDDLQKNLGEGLQQELQKKALEATLKTIEQKVSGLVCPVHGTKPSLKFSEGAGPGRQNVGFNCCCDTLKNMVQEVLKS